MECGYSSNFHVIHMPSVQFQLQTLLRRLKINKKCFSLMMLISSYNTLPLYALVTQMGTNYKAVLIPNRIRETIHGWGKAARRRRRFGNYPNDSTVRTDTSTVISVEEYDHQLPDTPRFDHRTGPEIDLQPQAFVNVGPVRLSSGYLRPFHHQCRLDSWQKISHKDLCHCQVSKSWDTDKLVQCVVRYHCRY